MPKKYCVILGTRPEIIKLSPLIRACIKHCISYTLIHTGQHYSYELDELIFNDLNLPKPDYNLHVGSALPGEQLGNMLTGIEKILLQEKPDCVLVLGDPNSAFAGAAVAARHHIPVAHIEAGRRSFDRRMPEEQNRLMIDQISDHLFTPNEWTKANLLREGISEDRIIVSGDTNVDAVMQNAEIAKEKSILASELNLQPKRYFLATIHRPENADSKENLTEIIAAFQQLSKNYAYPLIFPAHPKTAKMIEQFGISTNGITITKPLGYLDFLALESDAAVVLTDSGSLQEEACILHVPCITIREDTERQETVSLGMNLLASANADDIVEKTKTMLDCDIQWQNPFGEYGVAERILNYLQKQIHK